MATPVHLGAFLRVGVALWTVGEVAVVGRISIEDCAIPASERVSFRASVVGSDTAVISVVSVPSLETHLLAEFFLAPVSDVWVWAALEILVSIASTSWPEVCFPCALTRQADAFHIRCWRVGAAFAVGGRRRWSRAGEEFTFFAALLLAIFLAAGDFVVILLNEGSASVVFGDVVP